MAISFFLIKAFVLESSRRRPALLALYIVQPLTWTEPARARVINCIFRLLHGKVAALILQRQLTKMRSRPAGLARVPRKNRGSPETLAALFSRAPQNAIRTVNALKAALVKNKPCLRARIVLRRA